MQDSWDEVDRIAGGGDLPAQDYLHHNCVSVSGSWIMSKNDLTFNRFNLNPLAAVAMVMIPACPGKK